MIGLFAITRARRCTKYQSSSIYSMFDFVLLDIHEDTAQFFKFFADTALGTVSTLRLVHNTTLDNAGPSVASVACPK